MPKMTVVALIEEIKDEAREMMMKEESFHTIDIMERWLEIGKADIKTRMEVKKYFFG